MQIAWLDVIAIDDRETPHARAGQRGGVKAAQGAAAYNRGVGMQNGFLASLSDPRIQDLPRVTFASNRIHVVDGNKLALIRPLAGLTLL